MPEPRVVKVMRSHKEAILLREESVMENMALRWLRIERSLADDLKALALEAARMKEDEQPINEAIVMRMERMQKLAFQIRAETGDFVNWADERVTDLQGILAGEGIEHADEAIRLTLSEAAGVGLRWDRLNKNAVDFLIGLAGDGTPLKQWLRQVHPAAVDGVIGALLEGLARGSHPTKVAMQMTNGMAMGLQRAMNTARTETLRVYRQANLMQYEASGIVQGYKRVAAHDERVCAGCLFSEGQLFTDLTQFDEHNQGRCSMVPVLIGVDELEYETGIEWFRGQSARVQESILGTGRYEAWRNGASLESMVKRVEDPTWGGALVPMPVGELQAAQLPGTAL